MGRRRLRIGGQSAAAAGALLALVLLLAQAGALMHSYSHLRLSGEPLSGPGTGSQICADCLSYAPLLAAASGNPPSPPTRAPSSSSYRALATRLIALSPHRAFLPRGPPTLP